MKRLLLLLPLLLVAATFTDQLTADFAAGTLTDINATNNSIILNASGGNYSASGTFLSTIKDLGSNPTATISWTATSPTGTSVLVSSRSGNTSSVDANWSTFTSAYATAAGSLITAPTARYHQYRVQLATTDVNATPTVNSVTIISAEQGSSVTAAGNNPNINSDSSGTFRFQVQVLDTVSISSVIGRYRIGNGSYTAYSSMTANGSYYYFDIPEPGSTWNGTKGSTINISVQANNSNGYAVNVTFAELIDAVNHAPVLSPVPNGSATEGSPITILLSATDQDLDALSFTSSVGSITSTGNTSATLVWTPDNTQTGLYNITVSVSDGSLSDGQYVTYNVTDVNTAPLMQAVTPQSGHYGDQIVFTITVLDNDTADNITFYVLPDIFEVVLANSSGNTYTGIANFTALDDHRGFTNLTFYAQDTQNTTNATTTLNITYCGDGVCQSVENSTTCRADCYVTPVLSYIALEFPDRKCVNESILIQAFNASRRDLCNFDKRTYEYNGYCGELGDVELTYYRLNNSLRTEVGSATTNDDGNATFTTLIPSQYRVIATKTGFVSSEQVVTVLSCDQEISSSERTIQFDKPTVIAEERRVEVSPDLERPEADVKQTTWLEILIWYIIVPVGLAGLLFTGNIYYGQYKDTDPTLLAMRIRMWELRTRYEPVVRPYVVKLKQLTAPALAWIWTHGGQKVWEKIGPVLKKLDRRQQ